MKPVPSNFVTGLKWLAIAVVAVVFLIIAHALIGMADSFSSRAHLTAVTAADPPAHPAPVYPSEISISVPVTGFTCRLVPHSAGAYACTLAQPSRKASPSR